MFLTQEIIPTKRVKQRMLNPQNKNVLVHFSMSAIDFLLSWPCVWCAREILFISLHCCCPLLNSECIELPSDRIRCITEGIFQLKPSFIHSTEPKKIYRNEYIFLLFHSSTFLSFAACFAVTSARQYYARALSRYILQYFLNILFFSLSFALLEAE